jgi:hypothetical protein
MVNSESAESDNGVHEYVNIWDNNKRIIYHIRTPPTIPLTKTDARMTQKKSKDSKYNLKELFIRNLR